MQWVYRTASYRGSFCTLSISQTSRESAFSEERWSVSQLAMAGPQAHWEYCLNLVLSWAVCSGFTWRISPRRTNRSLLPFVKRAIASTIDRGFRPHFPANRRPSLRPARLSVLMDPARF